MMDVSGGKIYDGSVLFFLPDYRARVDAINLGLDGVTITLARKHSTPTPLRGKVYAEANDGRVAHRELSSTKLEEHVPLGFRPTRVYVGVLTETEAELLDKWELSPYRPSPEMELEVLDPQYVEQLISHGESESVEFKPGTRDDNTKKEWAETAIAFANRKGGTILVGVDDNGRMVGAFGGDLTDIISESLRDRSEPPIVPVVHQITAASVPIFVVRIRERDDKPHLLKGAGTGYLRIGSTDKPMTRYELDEMYDRRYSSRREPAILG